MKNLEGLYATYNKLDGSFIKASIKRRTQAHMSNKQSSSLMHELLTEDKNLMYDFPENKIPKKALTWSDDDFKSVSDDYCRCDLCNEYFEKKDMDFIPTEKQLEEHPGLCSQCIECAACNE